MNKFTAKEKAAEALREIGMRKYVYMRSAGGGELTKQQQRQIDIMQEIADDYAEQAKDERLI